MKYKITLGGKGGENYIHKISKKQIELFDLDVADVDEISELLNVSDPFETEEIVLGPYPDDESLHILVKDESENIIWDFDESKDIDSENVLYELETDCLVVQDYVKGNFKFYEIETDEFDPNKLKIIILEIGENIEIVVGLKYDGIELIETDYGDYRSGGMSYILIEK